MPPFCPSEAHEQTDLSDAKKQRMDDQAMMRWLDRCALVGMVAGVGLMLQPFWGAGLKYGFFVAAFSTVLHVATSRRQMEQP